MALKRRGITVLVVTSLVVLGLVGAYFIVDSLLRGYAENRVREEVVGNLPQGVTGDVAVSIGGISVIAQYLAGSFDEVDLTAPQLSFRGAGSAERAVASVYLVATDVPVDTTKPVGDVRGAIEIGQKSLNTLLSAAAVPGGPMVTLGAGNISYTGSLSVLGAPVGYTATATPQAAGDSVVLTPTDAQITTEVGRLDVSGVVKRVLGQKPIPVCVAQYLPAGVDLTGVDVTPERARITLHAAALKLTEESLSTLGRCPAG
jgi:hypothetical protein